MYQAKHSSPKKHTVWKVLGAVLLLLLVVLGLIGWQFRGYVFAARDALRYSTEEIEVRMQENEARIAKAVEETPGVQVRDLTEDEKQKLQSGEFTEDEVVDLLTGAKPDGAATQPSTEPAASAETAGTGAATAKPVAAQTDYSQQISEQIARAYVLRSQFTGRLDSLLEQAKAEYHSIPSKALTTDRKAELIEKYMGIAGDMEASCDASMNELVANVRQMLRASGQSTGLADEIASTYESEKQLKKSYYMSLYK